MISVRGNWPLTPTMDVVVPYARTMADLLEVLDVVVAEDPDTRGDLWRMQPWVPIPSVAAVRPESYGALAAGSDALAGKRFGVPRMFINADPQAGTSDAPGIGGPTGQRINTRASVIALWEAARKALEAAGAEVVEVDFPLVSNCEGDRPGTPTVFTRGLVSKEFLHHELWELSAWAFDDFLRANGDPALNRLVDVDGPKIFPHDPGTLPNREGDLAAGMDEYVRMAERGITPWNEISTLPDGLRGLEQTRRIDLEEWMDRLGSMRCSSRRWPTSVRRMPISIQSRRYRLEQRYLGGQRQPRHPPSGVPTVTVPMGIMADIGMPVGLTFAGRAYDDSALLHLASAFESTASKRLIPPRTPALA
ncbi:amidase [Pseudomonas sp. PCH446]